MGALQSQSQLAITDPPIWLWICGSEEAKVQVSNYAYKSIFMDLYDIEYSDYWPASNERLEDRATNNRLARDKMYLIFFILKLYKASKRDPIVIPKAFAALHTLI